MGAKPEQLVNNVDNYYQKAMGTVNGILKAAFGFYACDLCVCMPVEIVEVCDRRTRQLMVKPLVKKLIRESNFQERKPFAVKAFQFGGNQYVIDFPLKIGDVGWVIAGDRDTAEACHEHKVSEMASTEIHKYEYGFFIPDYYGMLMDNKRGAELNPYDGENNRLVISTFDGSQKVSVGRADIKVYANKAKVFSNTAEVKTTGDITLDAPVVKAKGSLQAGNGATGQLTSMTTAYVQNGIITSISGASAPTPPNPEPEVVANSGVVNPMLADVVPSVPEPAPTTISELQAKLKRDALAKRDNKSIEKMDTSGREGSGIAKMADNLATIIENTPPLEYIANKLNEGKQAAIDAINESKEELQEKFAGYFDAAKQDMENKLAQLGIVQETPAATDEGTACVVANATKAYLLLAYAEISNNISQIVTAATRIGTAVTNQVTALTNLATQIASLPCDIITDTTTA